MDYKTFKAVCKHQMMWKEGKPWCAFKNGHPAKCWDDWQECTEENCLYYGRKPKKTKSKQDIDGQMELNL